MAVHGTHESPSSTTSNAVLITSSSQCAHSAQRRKRRQNIICVPVSVTWQSGFAVSCFQQHNFGVKSNCNILIFRTRYLSIISTWVADIVHNCIEICPLNYSFAVGHIILRHVRTRGKINPRNNMTPRRYAAADNFDHAAAVLKKTVAHKPLANLKIFLGVLKDDSIQLDTFIF